MKTRIMMTLGLLGLISVTALAADYDYYKNLTFRPKLVPGVGLDQVDQAGGPDASGYQRRTVKWWPRKGQDIVDILVFCPA